VLILDMRPVCSYTDYFVVCTGNNSRQARAIFDEVREGMKREGGSVPRYVHGERDASWILADYLDVVLHVFTPEARSYYRLEELWGDVPSVEVAAIAR
jgi:ribosome-associated protein